MTTPAARRRREIISLVVSIATFLVLAVVFVLALIRNDQIDEATQANRATICAAAKIIALNPVRQYPDEKLPHYKKRLVAAGIFLRLAAKIDCSNVLATYGIRTPQAAATTTRPRGGDALRPQTGSQLARAAPDRRRRPCRHAPATAVRQGRPDRPDRRDHRRGCAISYAR